MTGIELVIKISEEDFTLIRNVNNSNLLPLVESRVMLAVKNGTPLPEHHSDLIERSSLNVDNLDRAYGPNFELDFGRLYTQDVVKMIENAPTIISATKPPHWIERRLQMGLHDWMCSECKCQSEDTVRICPNCGVDTEGRYEMEEDDGGYWFQQREEQTATKEKQTERKCESCEYHDGRGGCLDSCALCRYTPKQTATKEGE